MKPKFFKIKMRGQCIPEVILGPLQFTGNQAEWRPKPAYTPVKPEWVRKTNTHVYMDLMAPQNFGHQIADNLMAVYQAMRMFHILSPDVQILLLNNCHEYSWVQYFPKW